MAAVQKSISIEVTPKLTVDLETAQVCVALVNWFLEANEEYRLELHAGDDDVAWRLTDEPLVPATGGVRVTTQPPTNAVYTTEITDEQRAWSEKLRKLSGLDGRA